MQAPPVTLQALHNDVAALSVMVSELRAELFRGGGMPSGSVASRRAEDRYRRLSVKNRSDADADADFEEFAQRNKDQEDERHRRPSIFS